MLKKIITAFAASALITVATSPVVAHADKKKDESSAAQAQDEAKKKIDDNKGGPSSGGADLPVDGESIHSHGDDDMAGPGGDSHKKATA